MNLGDLKTLIRLAVPGAKVQSISEDTLATLINNAVREVNSYCQAYTVSTTFDVKEDQREYDIATEVASDYQLIGAAGIWWNNGTNWKELKGRTKDWLNKFRPVWRDEDSGDPLYYYVEPTRIGFVPTPDTALTDGFSLEDYIKKPTDMTDDGHYPFTGSTVEVASLLDLDEAIMAHVKFKLSDPLGKTERGVIDMKTYYEILEQRKVMIRRRPDLRKEVKMKVPVIK